MAGGDYRYVSVVTNFAECRFGISSVPAPGVAKPNRRQQMERRGFWTAVFRADANQNVVRVRFGVLDLDLEIAVLGEGARVPDFKFAFHLRAGAALRDQLFIRKTRLRIAIDHPHETVRRRV